ncbi:hypothetical protein M2137_000143 [Parabacteroides sp. PFB2-10]|nr:hypothetical protein [Parabacteroides sp. PFB2-10]
MPEGGGVGSLLEVVGRLLPAYFRRTKKGKVYRKMKWGTKELEAVLNFIWSLFSLIFRLVVPLLLGA